MEFILLIAFIVALILLLNIQSHLKDNKSEVKKDTAVLKNQLDEIRNELSAVKKIMAQQAAPVPTQQEKDAAENKAAEEQQQKIAALEALRRQRQQEQKDAAISKPAPSLSTAVKITAPATTSAAPVTPKENFLERWFKNNPDLEKFIGENLFNKIGIAVLVFGIAFFVKYAIDQNWINEYGRVAIGMGCGIILTVLAHRLRNNYRSFSSVLAGGGLAIFYFTITLAFHQYHIISQQAAFILMIVITAFAVLLSVLYNRLEFAVIAVAGGFLTPFMVSTGSGNYVVLFSYLIILNTGLLILSWFKKWRLINVLAFFFTIIIYAGWMVKTFLFSDVNPPYANALLFATIFYLLFLAMNMLNNVRRMQPFKAWDFTILLLINVCYYTAGMVILSAWHNGLYKGLFTAGLGCINLLLGIYFFKARNTDKNLLYLLIGLTLTFLSLAAPVQLHGHSITLFWCAEMVLLLWLHQRSGIALFKKGSAIIASLTIISLLMDWQHASQYIGNLPVIFSNVKGIVTNIVAVLAFNAYTFLLKKPAANTSYVMGMSNKTAAFITAAVAVVLAYITAYFSINLIFVKSNGYAVPAIYHRLLTYSAVLLLLLFAVKSTHKNFVWLRLLPLFAAFAYYVGNTTLVNNLRYGIIHAQHPVYNLWLHIAGVIILLIILYKTIHLLQQYRQQHSTPAVITWVLSFIIVFILSFEGIVLYTVLLKGAATPDLLQRQYMRAGLTIMWGLCSFSMMWLGMKHQYKTLRIISITLFGLALLKLFISDITDIGPGGKIAAFILLGVLLLVVSFMYQRLKKILIDDKTAA